MKKSNIIAVISLLTMVLLLSGALNPAFSAEPKAEAASAPAAKTPVSPPAAVAADEKMDINKATKEQLMTLPGIGAAEAQKIIDGRPYKSTSDLRKQEILPAGKFYKIIDKVTIRLEKIEKVQPAPATPAEPEKGKKPEKK